jgi:glycosyltransferase involved in cell wall biosynthesis
MKIACIATYPPRLCGIATFTKNLVKHIYQVEEEELASVVDVIAINNNIPVDEYPPEVKFTIDQQDLQDYYKGADYINFSDARICILEHEFGIFGGESGVHILRLIHRLQIPLIVTLHTILESPSFLQKSIIQELGRKADKLIVMSNLGLQFLTEIYQIPLRKIEIIEHGVPDFDIKSSIALKEKFHLEKRKIILTFGLLGRNKGVETILYALPNVVKKHPEVAFLILGKTHPNVVISSGESYRHYLKLIVREKDLENHVFFINEFVPEATLLQYLASTDIYITPYLNEAQITSGTLSYAIGAGAACLSTPYWHAKELLADGRGKLFDFNDHKHLEEIILNLLDNPSELQKIRRNAYNYGKQIRWSKIGHRYLKLAKYIVKEQKQPKTIEKSIINLTLIPALNLDHFKRLTDGTGILQHAKYGIPNLKEGYCLDDNARALLAALAIYTRTKDPVILELIPVYFSYIHYMQTSNGRFRNFMSFDRKFLDEEGSEDSFGRAIWALGYLIKYSPNDAYHQLALEIFEKAYPNFEKLTSLRGISNTLIGLSHYINQYESDERAIKLMELMRMKLVNQYLANKDKIWHWFEDVLTYDNAVVPLALYHSWQIVHDPEVLKVADESMNFLEKITLGKGYFRPVGSDGWYSRGGEPAKFAQQATDAMIMILLFFKAYQIKKRDKDLKNLFQCFTWFLGENDLRIPLYDHETNGCCDGLESYGVNRNQGAESTMAYLISNMSVLNAIELESEIKHRKRHPDGITNKRKDFLEPV